MASKIDFIDIKESYKDTKSISYQQLAVANNSGVSPQKGKWQYVSQNKP